MNEATRQEYLRTLGIQSYFPRKKLDGAPLSTAIALPETEPVANATAPLQYSGRNTEGNSGGKESASLALTRATLNGAAPEVPTTRQTDQQDSPDQPGNKAHPAAEARFQLAFIRVADMLVMVSLPHASDKNGLPPAQRQLFMNICRALKLPQQDADFSIKVFRWPFIEAAHMDKSEAAASLALRTYLAQLQEDFTISRMLLMGNSIAGLVADSLESELQICRSLNEMLKMPALKREAWQVLRTLGAE